MAFKDMVRLPFTSPFDPVSIVCTSSLPPLQSTVGISTLLTIFSLECKGRHEGQVNGVNLKKNNNFLMF